MRTAALIFLRISLACGSGSPPNLIAAPPPEPPHPVPADPAPSGRSRREGDIELTLTSPDHVERLEFTIGGIRGVAGTSQGDDATFVPFDLPGFGRVDPALGWDSATLGSSWGTDGETVTIEVVGVDDSMKQAALRVRYVAPWRQNCRYPGLVSGEGIRLVLAPVGPRGPCESACTVPNWLVYVSPTGNPFVSSDPDKPEGCTDEATATTHLQQAKDAFVAAGIDPAARVPLSLAKRDGDSFVMHLPSGTVTARVVAAEINGALVVSHPDLLRRYHREWIDARDKTFALELSTAHDRRRLFYPPGFGDPADSDVFGDANPLPLQRADYGHKQFDIFGAFEAAGKAIVVVTSKSQGISGSDPTWVSVELVGPLKLSP